MAGVIAVIALGIYALYFFALIKLIPITLTLPGIAGLILTVGVAADANIVTRACRIPARTDRLAAGTPRPSRKLSGLAGRRRSADGP